MLISKNFVSPNCFVFIGIFQLPSPNILYRYFFTPFHIGTGLHHLSETLIFCMLILINILNTKIVLGLSAVVSERFRNFIAAETNFCFIVILTFLSMEVVLK